MLDFDLTNDKSVHHMPSLFLISRRIAADISARRYAERAILTYFTDAWNIIADSGKNRLGEGEPKLRTMFNSGENNI